MSSKGDATRAEVKRLLETGITSSKRIAGLMGVDVRTVQRHRRDLGKAVEHVEYPEELWERARQMLEDRVSYTEVSRTLGPTPKAIARRFPGMGWTLAEVREFYPKPKHENNKLTPADKLFHELTRGIT